MMTPSAIPARRRLRAAVRRRSWNSKPGTPAALVALAQVSRKSRTGLPSERVKTASSENFSATHCANRLWTAMVIVTSSPCLVLRSTGLQADRTLIDIHLFHLKVYQLVESFDDAVVRNGLVDHWAEILGPESIQVNEGDGVDLLSRTILSEKKHSLTSGLGFAFSQQVG
jgi:hypothetical protein